MADLDVRLRAGALRHVGAGRPLCRVRRRGREVLGFLTYSFLHADFTHLAFNVLWLLPFGSAVARRFGAVRFFLFLAVASIAGAAAHLVTHAGELAPMIGASAAISGAMAAAIRFAFGRGSFLSFRRGDADAAARVPALPLFEALRHPRVITFLAVWFGINIIFGLGADPARSADAERRLAGAYRRISSPGLLLFSLFDPIPPASRNAADSVARRDRPRASSSHPRPLLRERSALLHHRQEPKRHCAVSCFARTSTACVAGWGTRSP